MWYYSACHQVSSPAYTNTLRIPPKSYINQAKSNCTISLMKAAAAIGTVPASIVKIPAPARSPSVITRVTTFPSDPQALSGPLHCWKAARAKLLSSDPRWSSVKGVGLSILLGEMINQPQLGRDDSVIASPRATQEPLMARTMGVSK